jgi:hypothetical protein
MFFSFWDKERSLIIVSSKAPFEQIMSLGRVLGLTLDLALHTMFSPGTANGIEL